MDEALDIEKVLMHYGASHVPTSEGWRPMRCVFHEDRSASASVSTGKGAFNCHACEAKGDVLGLIMWKEGLDFAGAKQLYEEITGESVPSVRGRSGKSGRIRSRPLSEQKVSYEGNGAAVPFGVRRKPLAGA